jgi:hypothetical protein
MSEILLQAGVCDRQLILLAMRFANFAISAIPSMPGNG